MDQKITLRSRISKKALIIIAILSLILIGILVYFYTYSQRTTRQIQALQQQAAELQPDTASVQRGDLTNTLEDIEGIVRSNQSVYLYWQTSGTVSEVNVEVGDLVSKGDVLAELDRSTIASSIIDAEVTRENAEESLDRLFTSALSLEQARTKVVQAQKAVEDAQKAYDALGIVRSNDIELGIKYDDYQRAIQSYNDAADRFEAVKDLDLDNVDRIRALSAMENAKYQMDAARAQYNWYNGEADEIDVQRADAALKLANAQLNDAERAYNRIKDGPTDNQIRSIQAQIDSAQATINTAKIIAPINGTVAQVEAKSFDVISYESTSPTRDILAVRIDDLSSHYIDITVTELEVNNIHLGQKVTITFDAIPLREYTGTITNISNAGTISNLSVNFALTVKMDEIDDSVKSGMMADVAIVTEQALDALYVPRQAISMADDGQTRIVQKQLPDGSFLDIPVRIGISSGTDTQIITDQLAEGDVVKLNKIETRSNPYGQFGGMGGMPNGGRSQGGQRPNR